SGGTTADATWNQGGDKTVTVTFTANGCTSACTAPVPVNVTRPDLTCTGDSLTCTKLTAATHVTVTNAADAGGPISYSWAGAGLLSGGTTADATWDQGGDKTVTVTFQANGCTNTCTSTVRVNVNRPELICAGDSLTCTKLTAVTHVTVANPGDAGGSISYAWSGAGLVSGGNTANATWSQGGDKTVTVTFDANGCTSTCTATVRVNVTKPDLACTGDSLTCTKLSATTHVTVNNAGAAGGAIGYAWSGAGLVSGGCTADAIWERGGDKTVTVTFEANGCTSTCTANVRVNVTQPHLACAGDCTTCHKLSAVTPVP